MRMIAEILGCPFHLNILDDGASAERSNNIEPDRTTEVSDKADDSKVVQKEEKREVPKIGGARFGRRGYGKGYYHRRTGGYP